MNFHDRHQAVYNPLLGRFRPLLPSFFAVCCLFLSSGLAQAQDDRPWRLYVYNTLDFKAPPMMIPFAKKELMDEQIARYKADENINGWALDRSENILTGKIVNFR